MPADWTINTEITGAIRRVCSVVRPSCWLWRTWAPAGMGKGGHMPPPGKFQKMYSKIC